MSVAQRWRCARPATWWVGGQRWVVLVAGLFAMTAGCTFQYGLAYLIPAFRAEGLSLEQAGILVACPTAGRPLTLVAGAPPRTVGGSGWYGAGLALAGMILLVGATVHWTAALGACLVTAGAAGASVAPPPAGGSSSAGSPPASGAWPWASGRAPQPLGVAVAALALPSIGVHRPPGRAWFPRDASAWPPRFWSRWWCVIRRGRRARPARGRAARLTGLARTGRPVLWRIHAASALLVVPQFAVATFARGLPGRRARAGSDHGLLDPGHRAGVRGVLPARCGRVVGPGRQPDAPDAGVAWAIAPSWPRWRPGRRSGRPGRPRCCSPR